MAICGTNQCVECELYIHCIRHVRDVVPPCAKNVNQLKAEIRALLNDNCEFYESNASLSNISAFLFKLRELSAV